MRAGRAALLLLVLAAVACGGGPGERDRKVPDPVDVDLPQIAERGTLRVLFTYNSTGYFIYRGEIMGFEFRLLRAFAEDHDLDIEPVVVREIEDLVPRLAAGDGDVIASRLVPTEGDREHVLYTEGLYRTRPAVVQRVGEPDESHLTDAVEELEDEERPEEAVAVQARLIRRPSQLGGEDVHVPSGSSYVERLIEISDLLTDDIHVVEVDEVASVEPLIRQVSEGEIALAATPENIGELKEEYFSNLVVMPALGTPEQVVWATRTTSPELRDELNRWLEANRGRVEEQYTTYFEDREQFRERVASEYLTTETGRLSNYDELIREHADEIDWDWRLLASQAFQESRFDATARSWAGAIGLLQLMPATAREVGVSNPRDPEDNVSGAVRYLEWLEERYPDIEDADEKLKFVLASYNAGIGHVADARRLAEKNGDDPDSWDDVAYWMLQKSKREVYSDPVVKYGFVRGLEPVTYVALILERYDHYRQFVPEEGAPDDGEGDGPGSEGAAGDGSSS